MLFRWTSNTSYPEPKMKGRAQGSTWVECHFFPQWIWILSFSRVDLKVPVTAPTPLSPTPWVFCIFHCFLLPCYMEGATPRGSSCLCIDSMYGHAFLLSNFLQNLLITELSLLPRMYCNICLSLQSLKVSVALEYLIM